MADRPQVSPITGFEETLQPAAAPVDTYVRPAEPAPSSLHGLASALSGFSQDLGGFLKQRQQKQDERDKIAGEAAAYEANGADLAPGYAQGVRSGSIPAYNSPVFVQSYKRAQGEIIGRKLAAGAVDAYQKWGGRNSQDPADMDKFVGDYIKQNLNTNDPDVLAGAMPYLSNTSDALYQANAKERADSLYANSVNAHVAASSMAIDNEQDVALTQGRRPDYDGMWSIIMGDRDKALASGIKQEDYDKSVVEMLKSKALEYNDPGILGMLKNKVPGQSYSYADTLYGQENIDATVETMQRRAAAADAKAAQEQAKADKDRLHELTAGVIQSLAADPNKPIPQAIIDEGNRLGDGTFAIKIRDWSKTLAQPQPEDDRSIMALQHDIIQDPENAFQLIFENVGDGGIIHSQQTLSTMINLANTMAGKGQDKLTQNGTVKQALSYLRGQFGPSAVDAFAAGQETPSSIQAQTDYMLSMDSWLKANPNATYADISTQATKVLKDMQASIKGTDGGQTYVRPQAITMDIGSLADAPALTGDATGQLLDEAAAAAHTPRAANPKTDPWQGDKPPTVNDLTDYQRQKVFEWAESDGVDPQVVIDRIFTNGRLKRQPPSAPEPTPNAYDGEAGGDTGLLHNTSYEQGGFAASSDPVFANVDVGSLPAGMRNNNPGNLKYSPSVHWRGALGPSRNTDQGDPQVVFASSEDGMRAAASLALHKWNEGLATVRQIITAPNGWTPGYLPGAEGVARASGLGLDQPLNLHDPNQMAALLRGIVTQEHGAASRLYDDYLIRRAVSGVLGA